MKMVTGCTGGDDGNRPIVEGNIAPKLFVKSRYKLADGKPFDDPRIHKHSPNDLPKMTFKINVGDVPEGEIEDYIRKVAEKFKKSAETMPDLDCGIYNLPDSDIYYPPKENTNKAMYMQTIPNSHFWTDLSQIVYSIQYELDRQKRELEVKDNNSIYVGEPLTAEYIVVGLTNSIKNGYKLKQKFGQIFTPEHYVTFDSIESMIEYANSDKFNLNDFGNIINNTLGFNFNLTNGLKMERNNVYKLIDGERDYQDKTWVARRTLDGTPDEEKPVAEWINYIEYHLSKAKERVYHLDTNGALAEIRKVTALGVRTMEIHGAPARIVVTGTDESICTCKDCSDKK